MLHPQLASLWHGAHRAQLRHQRGVNFYPKRLAIQHLFRLFGSRFFLLFLLFTLYSFYEPLFGPIEWFYKWEYEKEEPELRGRMNSLLIPETEAVMGRDGSHENCSACGNGSYKGEN